MPKIDTPCFALRMAQSDQNSCPVLTIWDVRPFLDDRNFLAVWLIHPYRFQASKHERYEILLQSRASAGTFETLHPSQNSFVIGG